MIQKQEELATLPGVRASLAAGFELTTKYWWLLLIPVLLDLFLWLGPRLSFQPLIEQLIAQWPTDSMVLDARPILELLAPRTNMFTSLSVVFIGVPALMTGLVPDQVPLAVQVIEIATIERLLTLAFLFTAVGLFLSAIFYSLIGRAVASQAVTIQPATGQPATGQPPTGPIAAKAKAEKTDHETPHLVLPSLMWLVPRTWLRFLALAALFLLLLVAIIIPVSLIAALVGLVSQQMAAILALSTPVLFFWALIFLSFTPQGAVLAQRSFLQNVRASVRLLQVNLIPAISLLLVIAVINRLLRELMLAADNGTWLTLASIVGHAFVTTALLVATFIFYRDRYLVLFADEMTTSEPLSKEPTERPRMNEN